MDVIRQCGDMGPIVVGGSNTIEGIQVGDVAKVVVVVIVIIIIILHGCCGWVALPQHGAMWGMLLGGLAKLNAQIVEIVVVVVGIDKATKWCGPMCTCSSSSRHSWCCEGVIQSDIHTTPAHAWCEELGLDGVHNGASGAMGGHLKALLL